MENSKLDMNLFRAPAALAIKTLDRSLFSKTLPATAALVRENKLLSKYRKDLEKTRELFLLERFSPIASHPDPSLAKEGRKCLILKPEIQATSPETWSPALKGALDNGDLEIIPYTVNIDYDLWSYSDVMKSILPEEFHDEVPSGFNTAGHVAHLNLRDQYLPFKSIIAQVILDKNPGIQTVINKIADVGASNEFRTFNYEVLAGPDDMFVEVSEAGCVFKFDYSQVYWNTKLNTEHERLVGLFKPGEVVADVMAGIGPFAVPAGKKGVFVWANDKNPASYKYLDTAITRNKVWEFVKPFNIDGHQFIHQAADSVLEASKRKDYAIIKPSVKKITRTTTRSRSKSPPPVPKEIHVPIPPTISHFVMNLPASALEFLHSYKGVYQDHENLFVPHTQAFLPMVHAHCFAIKLDDEKAVSDTLERIEAQIGMKLKLGNGEVEGEVTLHEVRDVAPNKRMFCASFRLPAQVAFAPRAAVSRS